MKNFVPVEHFQKLTRLLLSATLFLSIHFLFAADVDTFGTPYNTGPDNQHPPAAFAPPTASNPSPITVECKADVPAPDSTVVNDATSACGIKTIQFVSDVSDGATCPETITRTYEITDSCNASIQVIQSIIIHDLTPPTASDPPVITVECTTDVPAPNPAVVLDETDNCGVQAVNFISESSDNNLCPETITRTYEVLDSCGNSVTVSQDIVVLDVTAPVVNSLPDVNVSCKLNVPLPDPNIVSATDNCGIADINFVDDVSDGNSCPETIVRTYEVLDTCGNTATVSQNIIINDVTPPTASDPPDITESCFPPADPSVVTDAADNCGVESINFLSDVSDGNTCPELITRTYEVVDSCGNSITVSHQITIDDTTDPTASNPATLTVDCRANLPAPDPAVVTDEADNCGVESVTFVNGVSDGNTCPELITRTYEITDSCGNSTTVTHDIVVHDLEAPTATDPPNDTVSCPGDVPAPNTAVVSTYSDNCGVENINFLNESTDNGSCPETITHTYEILDSCANSTLVSHIIIVNDTTAPTASNPDTITANCPADAPAPDPLVVDDEADNCGVQSVTFVEDQVNLGLQSISRIYRITDSCGNNTDVIQMIMLNDNVDPTANDPPDMSVNCHSQIPAPDTAVITGESDNCAIGDIQFIGDSLTGHACPDTVIRTYRVIDQSGNYIDLEQEFYVNDNIPPTASNPTAIQVECRSNVPAPDPAVVAGATDNCGIAAINFVSDVSDGNSCPETVTRTYEVIDSCGNSITVTQDIIIQDLTSPVASSPPDTLVQCDGDVPVADPAVITTASDNCGIETINYLSESTDGSTCPETITRTYEVIDSCGNSTLVTRDVLIHDTIPPTASNPDTITIACIGSEPVPDPTVVDDEADNCGVEYVAFVDDVVNPGYIARTYEVVDSCGNSTNVVQTIMIDDNTPPTANTLSDVNLQCYGQIPAPDTALITASDNCAINDIYFVDDVSTALSCPDTVIRTYAVVDAGGNSINVTQRFIIEDVTPPTASNPSPIEVSCLNDVPAPDPTVVTGETDNCGVESVNFVSDVSDGNKCPEIITRTYEIVDSCGNTTFVSQDISILDTVPPTASNPDSTVVSCTADIPPANPAVVTDAADNCGISAVNLISESSNDQYCPETITRTYEVLDSCGNSITVMHKIIVNDLTPPTASNPDTIFVGCNLNVPLPDATVVDDEADNCGVFDVVYIGEVSDGNSCPQNITRTYQVIDSCGNTLNVSQIIQINDTTPPTASNPPDVAEQCTPPFDPTVVSDAADNCGVQSVNFVSDVSDGNSCPEVITRTYEVIDSCGNSITVSHQITINDTTAPTASNPMPVVVNCKAAIPSPDPLVVTDEADNCGVESVSFVSDVSDGNLCPETISRTYEITDSCGNSVQVSQSISVYDTIPPIATAPAPLSVNCHADIPAPDSSIVPASDNCGIKNINMILETSDGLSCPETITRTYEILDSCDNSVIVDHIITVNDTLDPVSTAPSDTTVNCAGDVPVADPSSVITADNCGVQSVSFVQDVSDGLSCPETITRTYQVTDSCGNTQNVTQAITVLDTIAPVAVAPADINVSCYSNIPAPDSSVVTGATDNCGVQSISFVSDVNVGSGCPDTVLRTYQVADACGNTVNISQNIIINDVTPPTAGDPDPVTVNCYSNIPAPDTAVVKNPSDNCGVADINFVSDVSDGMSCPETITRTYEVLDSCGNSVTVTQLITVNDTIAPVASNPPLITVACSTAVPAPDPTVVSATDNCGVESVTFIKDSTDGNICPQTIFRDYEISDSCGNAITVTQQIIVNDSINPVFAGMPADTVIYAGMAGCQMPVSWTEPMAQDNCSLDTSYSTHTPGDIFTAGTTSVIYTAMDDCGNTNTDSFTVTVVDTINPVVSCPGDTTIENEPGFCQAIYTWPSITATDNCGVDTLISSVPNGSGFMVGTTTVTIQAVDASGNIDSCSFNVTVLDTEDPVLDCPADIQTCDTIVDYQVVTATDNCGIQSLNQISGLGPNADYPVGVTINTYVAEDVNGNADTCTFTVEVFDSPDLVLTGQDETYQGAGDGQVSSTVTGGTPPYTYQWNTGDITPNIYNLSAGMYYLMLTDANGCMATDTVMLDSTGALPELEMPTAYSPNGDGANDFFVIKGIQRYPDNELFVYNRWGGLVYDQKGYSNQWNGKSNDGEELPDGTYYVILKIYSDDMTLTGYVYLKR